ncbi:MFS transporter [Jiangella rhizosphaerae]|uniref:MFS transporter n=1 Tax=Jiangella rhizosphaerae TaxID=2293569 RepID=A0A418KQZ2_9ACTN|nr:MFS transporter [Jiangella rhizosphaerae]RIQ23758.1 MFS transporter [Jiangella rhizosphaerae]
MTEIMERAGRREWIGLAVLTIPALLASMDLSVLFMAAPALSADLEPSGTQLLWIMDIYGFLMAGLLITMGSLGDRIGRRRLLLAGAVAFGAASLLAAYASSPEMLIAARALLGIGGATLAPSTLALIRGMFHDAEQRRAAIGVWTAAFTGGVAVGPIIGGLLLEHFWWGSVFLINLPVMVLLLIVGPLLLPESRNAAHGGIDVLSAVLSLAAVLPVIYGIKEIAADAAVSGPAVALIAAGLVVGVVFVRRQRSLDDPMIDVRLFRSPSFSAAVGTNAAVTFATAGMGAIAVQYVQVVLGIRPFAAALWMLPTVGGTIVGIAVANLLVRRIAPGIVVGAGALVAALGFALVTATVEVDSAVGVVIACYTVLVAGVGMAASLVIDLIVGSAPPSRAGSVSAMSETAGEFGAALGIAVLGSIAAAVYAGELRAALPEVSSAATGSLGAATALAGELPPEAAGELLAAAREAFTQGFTVTAAVGSVVLAFLALVAVAVFTRRPATVHRSPVTPK